MNQIFFKDIQKIIILVVILLIVTAISRKNLISLINTFSLQSLFISLLSILLFFHEYSINMLLVGILTFVSKCFAIPHVLKKTRKSMNIHIDLEYNMFTPTASVFFSLGIIIALFFSLSSIKKALQLSSIDYIGLIIGLSMLFIGMLITIGRKKILTKTIGYLMMENGIIFAGLLIGDFPFFIEGLILMDLLMILAISSILGFGMDSSVEDLHKRLNPFKNWFKKVDRE